MANHIESVKDSSIPKVNKIGFYAAIRSGDLVFCSGREAISVAIENAEVKGGSPFSHVLMAWLPGPWCTQWLTLESTIDKGVHVGLLADYLYNYDGDIILARRRVLSGTDIENELNAGLALLDNKYNWRTEVTYAIHNQKLFSYFPIVHPENEQYCSGLQQVMSYSSISPIKTDGPIPATPEQIWIHPSVSPVCAIVR